MRKLRLQVLEGEYAVWQLRAGAELPRAGKEGLWSVVRTGEEVSVVSRAEEVPAGAKAERGWRCIGVEGPIAFEEVGVLAAITAPLAEAGVSVFAMSTYDTDYVLVKGEQLDAARRALKGAGHTLTREQENR